MLGMIMFVVALLMLLLGFPVAFTFAGVALFFGVLSEGFELFAFMPYRIQSVMENTILMAIPLFIFMGVVLQKTRLAEQLLVAMAQLFGRVNGGIPPSIILIILGDVLGIPVGELFQAAVAPGVLLIALYIGYILFITAKHPEKAPALPPSTESTATQFKQAIVAILPPLALMLVVLGSIFSGVATPTESSALDGLCYFDWCHRIFNDIQLFRR